MKFLTQLVYFLVDRRSQIVKEREVLVEVYDPTYGLQDPRSETIEIIDFDALLWAIDEFSSTFKE